jgi:DNA polymerase-4
LKIGVSLTCSIGLAPNRYLAKIAADMKKPDGLTVILKRELPERLYPLALRDFSGLGPKMEERLLRAGVYSVEILMSFTKEKMATLWGSVVGEYMYAWLRGEDLDWERNENVSVSHSHVLPPELRNLEGAHAVLSKLLFKAVGRMRKKGLWCQTMGIAIRAQDQTKWKMGARFLESQDYWSLSKVMEELWAQKPPSLIQPFKVGIWLGDMVPDSMHQASFFEEDQKLKLSNCVDAINQKFGAYSVVLGGFSALKSDAAPTRIAFTNIPQFEV